MKVKLDISAQNRHLLNLIQESCESKILSCSKRTTEYHISSFKRCYSLMMKLAYSASDGQFLVILQFSTGATL